MRTMILLVMVSLLTLVCGAPLASAQHAVQPPGQAPGARPFGPPVGPRIDPGPPRLPHDLLPGGPRPQDQDDRKHSFDVPLHVLPHLAGLGGAGGPRSLEGPLPPEFT